MDRRKFLKNSLESAKVVSLLGLSGCAALDRYFEIEKSDYSKEVLVFGGGIAGLSTAYFLKKSEVPYRVFESSDRIGGRVLSQRFPSPINAIEMGARYIDSMDQDISELIKEMNLELVEAPVQKNALFFCLNKEVTSYKSVLSSYSPVIKLWNKELVRIRKLTDQLDQDPENESYFSELLTYDKIALNDVLNDSKLDFKGRFIFKSWAESHFQKKVTDVTFLEWLYFLEKLTLSGKKLYLPEGLGQFIDILGQRVSGVIPNYNMQVNTRLIEISRQNDRWICHIQTKEGVKKLSSPFVVLALPFNQIKNIKGIDQIFTNKEFKESLFRAQFKSSYRVVFKSNQKSTRENGVYYFFESNKIQVSKDENLYSIDFDQPIDSSNVVALRAQLSLLFGIKDFEEINFYSWSQNPHVGGSELKLERDALLSIKTAYHENWHRLSLQLAGDYLISPDNPNLNDCVKTAFNAAKNITTLVLEKEFI